MTLTIEELISIYNAEYEEKETKPHKGVVGVVAISEKYKKLSESDLLSLMKEEAGFVPAYHTYHKTLNTTEGPKWVKLRDYHFGYKEPTAFGSKWFDGLLGLQKIHGNVYYVTSTEKLSPEGSEALEELLAKMFIERQIDAYIFGDSNIERKRRHKKSTYMKRKQRRESRV